MDDLFGHTARQAELFPPEPAPAPAAVNAYQPHTPDTIREKMLGLLAVVRDADTMPWGRRMLRSYSVRFPMMAAWLPKEEGTRLLTEFGAELERLGAPAPPPYS